MSKKPSTQVITSTGTPPLGTEVYVLTIKPDAAAKTAYHDVRRAVEMLEREGHAVEWRSA